MKNLIYSIFCTIAVMQVTVAQVPNLMSYQAVIWDGNGNVVSEKMVNIKLSILQGTVIGQSVYSETHRIITNSNGLVSLLIGGGSNVEGKLTDIKWGISSYFLKTETDPTGGINFSIIGINQLVSVPYALFAGNIQTQNLGLPGQVLKLDEFGKPYWAGESFPAVSTVSVSSITTTTAVSGGNISSDGGSVVTARGVVWSTSASPTISLTTKTSNGTGVGTFSSTLTGLSPNTTYYVRAYATNSVGTGYGNEVTFKTNIQLTLPIITTQSVSAITTNSATSGGNVSSDGGSAVTARGVVWSTSANPTISLITKTINGSGTGTFSSSLTSLSPNTTYYVKAYASNSVGTGYGNEFSFKTTASSNSDCTVNGANGEILTFSCYNLGAVATSDPYTPRWELNGDYWQWGRKEKAANGPSNGTAGGANDGEIASWNKIEASFGAWSDANKTPNDPCPSGYRVPTMAQWNKLLFNNIIENVGGNSWTAGPTNYSFGKRIRKSGDDNGGLFLPAAGVRNKDNGWMYRGDRGDYWGSSEAGSFATALYFSNVTIYTGTNFRGLGMTIRCIKELSLEVPPTVTTSSISAITSTTATSGGNISSDGGSAVTTRGVVWSTSPNPTISLTTKTSNGSGIGSFSSSITGLTPNTTYYVRAYATNSAGTGYGNEITFTTSTSFVLPTVSTISASSITTTNAISGGNISSDGGSVVTARGVVWSTSANPTISLTTKTSNGTGTGTFSSSLTSLTPNTAYYVRAYATNSAGTSYGNQVIFITNSTTVPSFTVTTSSILAITSTTATSGGNISSEGGAEITARGVVWSTSANPTISLTTKTSNGTGTGTFSSSLTGLSPNTTYYVRAYATISAGTGYSAVTGYGNQVIFTTSTSFVLPTVSTISASSISTTTAISIGNITSDGGSAVTARGVVWSTSPNPTISLTTKTSNGTGIGTFSSSLTGLSPNTTYYVRAYATNSAGTGYGNEITFKTSTLLVLPTVSTVSASSITTNTATTGGNISSDGGSAVTARGVVWSTSSNPTISLTTKTSNGTGIGTFSSSLTGLTPNTTYYVRAYATNSAGTGYGNQVIFTTSTSLVLPTLSTISVSSITTTTAVSGGNISSDGGTALTTRGVVWSTSPNPTISLTTKTSNGTGTGTFSSSLTGLSPNTSYYVRAYATNSAGTGYGNEITFKTSTILVLPTVSTVSTSSITTTTATSGGNISSDGGSVVTARGVVWSTSANPTISLTTKTINGSGTGAFSSSLTGLSPNTTYYVRAYATNSTGTGYGNEVTFKSLVSVISGCTVNGANGEILTFSCYNLGAVATSDPYTPRWELNGDYWQWGRKEKAANGPSNGTSGGANDGEVTVWNRVSAPIGAWSDANKTANDPCPSGFRVPTSKQWESIMSNNIKELDFTFSLSPTHYDNGLRIKKSFDDTGGVYLPFAGERNYYYGSLNGYRSVTGSYWSSSVYATDLPIYISFPGGNSPTGISTQGMSVRCIAE